jgi:hypothetical protein
MKEKEEVTKEGEEGRGKEVEGRRKKEEEKDTHHDSKQRSQNNNITR